MSRSRSSVVLGPWLLLAGLASATPAAAETSAALLAEGIHLHSYGEFERSLQVLRQVARAAPRAERARARLYIGFNHALLGQDAAAREALARCLADAPDLRPDPRRFKASLLRLLDGVRDALGELRVGSPAPGARVRIDGQAAGRTPHHTRLPAGKHWVEVLDGEASFAAQVTLRAGGSSEVEAVFDRPAAVRPAGAGPRRRRARAPSFWRRPRRWTWVAAGAAAVAAVTAGVVWAAANAQRDGEWSDQATTYSASSAADRAEARAALERIGGSIETKLDATNALLGTAAVLTVTAGVLLLLEGRGPPRERPRRRRAALELAPVAGPAAAGVTLRGRF